MTNQMTAKQKYVIEKAIKNKEISHNTISDITGSFFDGSQEQIDRITIKMAKQIINILYGNRVIKDAENSVKKVFQDYYESIQFDMDMSILYSVIETETAINCGYEVLDYVDLLDKFYPNHKNKLTKFEYLYKEYLDIIGNIPHPNKGIYSDKFAMDSVTVKVHILHKFISILLSKNLIK